MAKVTQVKPRQEISADDQWDLTTVFETDDAWQVAYEDVAERLPAIEAFRGRLSEGDSVVIEAFETILAISRELEKVVVYANMKHDQETQVTAYIQMNDRAEQLATQTGEATAWFEPEVLSLSDDIKAALSADEHYGHYFEALLKKDGHVLSDKEEALLSTLAPVLSNSENVFSYLSDTDLKFGEVTDENGEKITISHGSYGKLLESSNRELRKQAFHQLHDGYRRVNNTMASVMSGNVKNHNVDAKVHNYHSAREAAMAADHIPEEVYDTLVETVHRYLPLLHRYVALRKQLLDVDQLYPYDLYVPLTGEAPISYTFAEAKEELFKALAPLGEDYLKNLHRAFDEHWIDIYENIGKTSGAYSSGVYDTNPFVLLNWQDSLNDYYTLAHELGHSMHSLYTAENQPYVYGSYPIFLAEIASTTNENILTHYLLETKKNPETQIYLLSYFLDSVKGTIFRQTQFAEFEHFMHQAAQEGQALTPELLNEKYFELNSEYYGPALSTEDRDITYEWSRIPHFYYDYYVYQYATGFSAATALAERVTSGDPEKVDAYLQFLKSGDSDYPLEIMKRAGVDMTNADYIEATMKLFEQRLDQLEALLSER
ncbi:oligoendopeptidase F [Aerococcus vaginalis]